MPKPREIYLLDPSQLSQEVIAVAFAKTSRSPESFREIAAGLTDASSAQFHERWVVGYGHASVAEHAVLHLAFENVSRLAIEAIESSRLASYTEKSTRYQLFERDGYYTPEAIARSPHADRYHRTLTMLFDTYSASIEPVRVYIASQFPRKADEDEKKHEARIRSKTIDNCRFLLPTATLANVGVTANARVLEHAIVKMLSHPLQEVREIGEETKRVAQAEAPTLVKYAEPSEYLEKIARGACRFPIFGLQPPISHLTSGLRRRGGGTIRGRLPVSPGRNGLRDGASARADDERRRVGARGARCADGHGRFRHPAARAGAHHHDV